MLKIGVAGAYGAFGLKHLDALANIPEAEVVAVFGPNPDKITALAAERGIANACADYNDFLAQDIDAVILSTPTQLHCEQSIAAMHICSGTTPATPLICFSTRPERSRVRSWGCRDRLTPSSASRWT